jgi:hypothetical protein
MEIAKDECSPKLRTPLGGFTSRWHTLHFAALFGFVLIPSITMPQLARQQAADAAINTDNSSQQSWFPAEYRAWKKSSAWKPHTSSFLWDRPPCNSEQTCLPVKVLTRDDCNVLAVSASLLNSSTGQTLLATAKSQKVEAGQEQNLTLRWNLPPSQANPILARESDRKAHIGTLGDHQGNSSLQELVVAHISARLIPTPPAWQSVTIKDIRCL